MLQSNDPAQIRSGIEAMGLIGNRRVIDPLAARIRAGLPTELLGAAVDTLMVLSRPEAGPILFELTTHRRPEIRLKAVQAIVASEPRGADRALITALSDMDPRVRAAAALGLGERGATSAVDPLFHALDRHVTEASTAIGQIANPAQIDRLLEYLGRLRFDALTPALSEVLARDDVPRAKKLDVIAKLSELATPEVKQFLQDYVASLPEPRRGRPDPVREAAEDAILRIAD